MQAHLEQGCQSCGQTVQWLRSVVHSVASMRRDVDPPASLVAQAKAIFRPVAESGRSSSWMENLETVVAHLVMVSSGDWLPAGVRSTGSPVGERLLYRAAPYTIEMTFDPAESWDGSSEIVGQITDDRAVDPDGMGGILVQVWAGERLLGESETNPFGEFVTSRPQSANAVMRFAGRNMDGRQLEVRFQSRKEKPRQ